MGNNPQKIAFLYRKVGYDVKTAQNDTTAANSGFVNWNKLSNTDPAVNPIATAKIANVMRQCFLLINPWA